MIEQNLVPMPGSVLEAVAPYQMDDCHKGTFLVLRISGMDQPTALRLIDRKKRAWQDWRSLDEYFRDVDDRIPQYQKRFGGEARVLRMAMLDSSIIETGIAVFQKILRKEPVSSDMWSYVTKLAGLRVPVMGSSAKEEENQWERLANTISNTIKIKELTVKSVQADGTEQSITAKEQRVQAPANLEQQAQAVELVRRILDERQESKEPQARSIVGEPKEQHEQQEPS